MTEIEDGWMKRLAMLVASALFVALIGSLELAAQFPKLPKAPKLPGTSTPSPKKNSDIKPAKHDTPEIVDAMPEEVLPKDPVQVTLTGKKLYDGMPVRLECYDMNGEQVLSGSDHYFGLDAKSVMIQNGGTSAVASFAWPANRPAAKCGIRVPNGEGSAHDVVVTPTANGPKPVHALMVAEGNLQFMEVMMKFGEAQQRMGKDQFVVSPAAMKYTESGGKVIFDRPLSAVKAIEPLQMPGGQSSSSDVTFFRVIFSDGRIYNFMKDAYADNQRDPYKTLKQKAGK